MAKPRVFATAGLAFSDTVRAARAMPTLTAVSSAAAIGYALFNHVAPRDGEPGGLLVGLVSAILMTPIFIAVLRFIIMEDVAPSYRLDLNDARFRAYCAWSFALYLVVQLPTSLATAYLEGDQRGLAAVAWIVVSTAVTVWSILIFPAIAADAPGATLRSALADLRGSFWRVLAVLWGTYLPFLIVAWTPYFAYFALRSEASDSSAVADTISSVAVFCSELVWAAASARLFLALADRLRSPAST